jgi:type III secretory pathway component EscS
MSETALLRVLEQGLLLLLSCAGPPLLVGAMAGALTDWLQRRAGVEEPGLPRLLRIVAVLLTAMLLAPTAATQLARFATALWAALPLLGQ